MSSWVPNNTYLLPQIQHRPLRGYNGWDIRPIILLSRNFIEIVSDGGKGPNAKYGIPSQIKARQGLTDYLDREDIGPVDLRRVFYRFEHHPARKLIAKLLKHLLVRTYQNLRLNSCLNWWNKSQTSCLKLFQKYN